MKYKKSFNEISLAVQFRHMAGLNSIRLAVADQLERITSLVTAGARCDVVVDNEHSARKEGVYEVSVRLHVPGQRLYVSQCTDSGATADVIYGMVYDVFDDIRRQLLKTQVRFDRQQLAMAIA